MDYDEFDVEEDQLEEVEILENQEGPDGEDDLEQADEGNDQDDGEMDVSDEGEEDPLFEVAQDMSNFTFTKHTDYVYCVSMHPTKAGLVATGGGDDKAYLWRFLGDTESCIELLGHTDTVTSVGFNFNGSLLLSGSYDGTVRIWDVETGANVQVLDGPEDVEWAVWHNKGNAVLAGSKDGTIWMWLSHNGQCMQVFAGHDGLVSSGCFSDNGKFVCSAGEDGTVRIWLPKTGACKHVFDGHMGHGGPVTCLSTLDDLLLTGSQDGTAKVYQLSGCKLLHTFVHSVPKPDEEGQERVDSGVESVGFSSDTYKWIATGGMDKELKVWDLSSGSCRVSCKHDGGVVSLRWHTRQPFVCTTALDGLVRIWDARNGNCSFVLSGHSRFVTNLDIQCHTDAEQESVTIVSVSDDHTAKVFNVHLVA